MINQDGFAFPSTMAPNCRDGQTVPFGLTKRELFAAMAMQGWLANKERPTQFLPKDDMEYCVAIADNLLIALAKPASSQGEPGE